MSDISLVREDGPSSTEPSNSRQTGRVYLSGRRAQGFASDRSCPPDGSSCYFEEYQIEIGSWKATIVKTLDYAAGRTRFRARYDGDQPYRRRDRAARRRRRENVGK